MILAEGSEKDGGLRDYGLWDVTVQQGAGGQWGMYGGDNQGHGCPQSAWGVRETSLWS